LALEAAQRARRTDRFLTASLVHPAVRLGYACQSNAHARAVAADEPDVPSVGSFDHGEPPVSDEHPRAPAAEQAALRRVATLVARGVPPEEVFAAVTKEVGRLIGVEYAGLNRYEPDRTTMTIVSVWSRAGGQVPPGGTRQILGGKNISTIVFQTGRAARIDGYADSSGLLGLSARDYGIGSGVGTPILVEGRLWGVMSIFSKPDQPLPADTEARLASFTELVATAIANAESRARLAGLAAEQAALRRVATLVARGVPPEEVFAAVVTEVGQLLAVDLATMGRYEPDGTLTFVGSLGNAGQPFPAGSRKRLGGNNLATIVSETGRPARLDRYAENSSGPLGVGVRGAGIRSSVATPIMVEGCLWGVIAAGSTREQTLPADTEARLGSFTELVATAIANADSHAALAASRARIVAAADESRRQIERDLHDGAQQRLVHAVIVLKLALRALSNADLRWRAMAQNRVHVATEGDLAKNMLAMERHYYRLAGRPMAGDGAF